MLVETLRQSGLRLGDDSGYRRPGWLDIVYQVAALTGPNDGGVEIARHERLLVARLFQRIGRQCRFAPVSFSGEAI